MESELSKFERFTVPNTKDGIGTRIEEVAKEFDGRKAAANVAGVSPSTLARWISEESSPIFQQLGRLVFRAGYSLDWVYSGIGPKRLDGSGLSASSASSVAACHEASQDAYVQPLDADALELAITVLERVLESQNYKMHPEDKAGMAMSNYELLRTSSDRAATANQIRLILERAMSRHGQ